MELISNFACRCVGWYHSHPHALPHPSPADIAFQIQLQQSEGPGPGALPQFAIIVSPFKAAREDGQAGMTLFQAKAESPVPMSGATETASWQAVEFKVCAAGIHLTARYKPSSKSTFGDTPVLLIHRLDRHAGYFDSAVPFEDPNYKA